MRLICPVLLFVILSAPVAAQTPADPPPEPSFDSSVLRHAEEIPPPATAARRWTPTVDDCLGAPPAACQTSRRSPCHRPVPKPPCPCEKCKKKIYVVQRPCPREGGEENAPFDENAAGNPGVFVAPPETGRVYEESGGRGVSGLKIRFPELELALPTIELPSCFHFSQRAHMRTAGGTAPYVPLPVNRVAVNEYAVPTTGGGDESAPAPDDEENGEESSPEEAVAECEAKIEKLLIIEHRISTQLLEMQKCIEALNRQRCQPVAPPRPQCLPPCAPSSHPLHPLDTPQATPVRQANFQFERQHNGISDCDAPAGQGNGELRRLPPVW